MGLPSRVSVFFKAAFNHIRSRDCAYSLFSVMRIKSVMAVSKQRPACTVDP